MAYSGTPYQPVEGYLSSGWGSVSGPVASSSRLPQGPHRTNQESSMFGAANLANQAANCASSKRRNSRLDSGHLAKKPRTGEPQMTMVSYQQQHSSSSLIPSPNASLSVNPYTHDDGEHRVQIHQITNHYHSVNIQHAVNPNFGANYGNFTQAVHITSSTSDAQMIDKLPRNRDASGLLSEYLEGSRDKETQAVYEWIKSSPELVLWVHAPAGLGKSTFARHLGEDLRDKGQLAAALFMSFTSGNLGPETVIKLIAGEIARIHPLAVPSVVEAIKNSSGSGLSSQRLINNYVKIPIQSLNLPHPLIVLMDAADEWASHQRFLEQLAPLESSCEIVKFIVFTRTTPRLSDFPGVSIQPQPLPPASEDVLVHFFNHHFTKVRWQGEPPSEQQVKKLAEKASGIFVWAWTVLSLIKDDFVDALPKDILEQTLNSHRTIGDSDLLAQLYYGSIQRSFPKPEYHEQVRKYLEAIFVLEEPLPVADFSALIDMKKHVVENVRRGLRALQTRDPHDSTELVYPAASIFHLSVMEYFQSSSTPRVHAFDVSTIAGHEVIGGGCLALLPKLFPVNSRCITLPVGHSQGLFKYVTTTWPNHVANSLPPLATNPDPEDWKVSKVYNALENVAFEVVEEWATALMSRFMSSAGDPISEEETQSLLRSLGVRLSEGHAPKGIELGVACLELAVRLLPDEAKCWCYLGWGQLLRAEARTCRRSAEAASIIHRHALKVSATVDSEANVEWIGRSLADTLASRVWLETGSGSCVPPQLEEAISMAREGIELADGDEERASWLTTLSKALDRRFTVTKNTEDMEESLSLIREALKLTPSGDSCHPGSLYNLSISLRQRFDVTACPEDLEESITLCRQVLELLSGGCPDRALCLLSMNLDERFGEMKCLTDLEESITLRRQALELLPEDHPVRVGILGLLATSLNNRFDMRKSLADLEECITLRRQMLGLLSEDDPERARLLCLLVTTLNEHFDETGSLANLEERTTLCRQALELLSEDHPVRGSLLGLLATLLNNRFSVRKSLADLEECITLYRQALELLPEDHPDRANSLCFLSTCLNNRFDVRKSLADLEECITVRRQALELLSEDHPDRAGSLSFLSAYLKERFNETECLTDLEECITLRRQALELLSQDHPARGTLLSLLASSLNDRFDVRKSLADLEECITLRRQELGLLSEDHQERARLLCLIATSLSEHFDETGSLANLEESITLCRQALELLSEDHPVRICSLCLLSETLDKRFQEMRRLTDLEECITLCRQALQPPPEGHPAHGTLLILLASSLYNRFDVHKSLADLEECITVCRQALELLSEDHPERARLLFLIATSLNEHFDETGSLANLEECITLHRQALELLSEDHPDRAVLLSFLSSYLDKRYNETKCLPDLEECIALCRQVLELLSEDHPGRAGALSRLSAYLDQRFNETKCLTDLEECITVCRQALELLSEDHPVRGCSLSLLATSLNNRFDVHKSLADLEECITLRRQALELLSEDHPGRPESLGFLAATLNKCFDVTKCLADLEESILLSREVLKLWPTGHPNHPHLLDALAVALDKRFAVTVCPEDLEESIVLHRNVLILRPPGYYHRYKSLWDLGWALFLRFAGHLHLGDLYEAIAVTDEALELCPSDAPADRRTLETNKSFFSDTLASFSAS